MNKLIKLSFVFSLFLTYAQAATYPSGITTINMSDGTLSIVSGLMDDNVAQRYNVYSFYFTPTKSKVWNQVAIVNKSDDRDKLTYQIDTIEGGEAIIKDTLVVKKSKTYLLVGNKQVKESYYDDGPITVSIYSLERGEDGSWPYSFVLRSKKTFGPGKTVSAVLSAVADTIH